LIVDNEVDIGASLTGGEVCCGALIRAKAGDLRRAVAELGALTRRCARA
jgi:hypothetical protein